MSIPTVTGVELAGKPGLPLLLLGPSLGTSTEVLWSAVATRLGDTFHAVGWDLPGHGANTAPPAGAFEVADLARAVLALADRVQLESGQAGTPFFYAGDSVGGAVGQQLLLDAPGRVRAAALLCTSARFGDAAMWRDRADLVREKGTEAVVDTSTARWFPDGFVDAHPDVALGLLQSLRDAHPEGYAATCEALAAFDVRERLADVTAPVLAIAGAEDVVTPAEGMRQVAETVQRGRLVVLAGVAHLAPAEAPEDVARLLREHFVEPVRADGMRVRREVLGDEHVDRATANTTDFTRDFQAFITEYAWGGIWTRPGLDRRSRSMITLTALIARGHHEELAMHVRAARRNGLSVEEIEEVILQSAIYLGVPDANTAFRIAQKVLDEETP